MAGKKIKLVPIGEEKETQQTGREAAQSAGTKNRIKLVSDGTRDWANSGTKANPVVTEARKQETENLYQRFIREAREKKEVSTLAEGMNNEENEFLERIQDYYRNADFSKKSVPVQLEKKDKRYNYINDLNNARANENLQVSMGGAQSPYRRYDAMTEQEIQLYNYLYATEGKESADRFLDSMADTFALRFAEENAPKSTAAQILSGFPAGVQQFATGISQLFSEKPVPVEIASAFGQVNREKLAEKGPTVLGQSLGQIAYDATQTVGNQIVPMAVGAATRGGIGTILMGTSSAGNAYREKLEEGWDPDQAMTYGAITGALEGGLQYILGGISSLGGTSKWISQKVAGMENAAARFALQFGGSMASEGLEEGLQEALSPVVEAIITKEDLEPAKAEDIMYSALLGMLTAGAIEAPGLVIGRRSGSYNQVQENADVQLDPAQEAKPGQDPAAADTETDGGLTLTMPEELVQPGDYQAQQPQQESNNREKTEQKDDGLTLTMPEELRQDTDWIVQQEKQATAETQDGDVQAEFVETARRLGQALGRDIQIYNGQEEAGAARRADGYYSNGKLHINSRSIDPVAQVIGHELTHSLENTGAYRDLERLVKQRIQDTGGDISALREEKQALYARNGVQMENSADIDHEIVAEYVAKNLLPDEKSIMEVVSRDKSLGRRILDFINSVLAKLGNSSAKEKVFLTKARDAYANALAEDDSVRRAQSSITEDLQNLRDDYAQGKISDEQFDEAMQDIMEQESLAGRSMLEDDWNGTVDGDQYSISESYQRDLDTWERDGRPDGEVFILGETGDVMQGLGAMEQDIYLRSEKVNTILREHPEMTMEEIRKIPEILDDPVLVLKSRNRSGRNDNTRLVVFGTVKAKNGQPVLTVLDLRPRENRLIIDDMQKVNSAYTRDNAESYISGAEVLYADENRTIPLLKTIRKMNRNDSSSDRLAHTGPIRLLRNGSMGSITYGSNSVNLEGVPFDQVVETQESERQYSISESYQRDLDTWERDGRPDGEVFILGATGDVMQGLGAMEQDIYLRSEKVNTILREHPEMTMEEIRRIPEILDDPVLVLKSRNVGRGGQQNTRLVLFGTVRAENGQPVLTVLDLRPVENGMAIDDMQKVTSSYTKDSNPVWYVRNSDILYADKNRTIPLLRTIGFQMPIELQRSGSIGSISYNRQNVNIQGVPFDQVVETQENGRQYSINEKREEQEDTGLVLGMPEDLRQESDWIVQQKQNQSKRELRQGQERDMMAQIIYMEEVLENGAGQLHSQEQHGGMQFVQEVSQGDGYLRKVSRVDPTGETSGRLPGLRTRRGTDETTGGVESENQKNSGQYGGQQQKTAEGENGESLSGDANNRQQYSIPDKTEGETIPDSIVDTLPAKAKLYLEKVENAVSRDIRKRWNLSGNESIAPVGNAVRKLSEEYLQNGEISREAIDRIFDEAYESSGAAENAPELQKEDFRMWARHDFDMAAADMPGELKNISRYAQERKQKEAGTAAARAYTTDEIAELWKDMKAARRNYERVNARNLLTEHDQTQVRRLLKGDIELQHLKPGEDNIKGITNVYNAKLEYEKLSQILREWNQAQKAQRRQRADTFLETANEWKDKPMGILYSRETMERNIRDIVKDETLADAIIKEYFEPVHRAAADSNRLKNQLRDKVRGLDLSRKVEKGNQVSEAYAVQLLGEAEDNIRVMENSQGRIKVRDGKTLEDWKGVLDDLWKQNPNLDQEKIRNAVKEFRSIYDQLFEQMNETRIRNGYEPVNYRQGYFPHFQSIDGDGILAQFGRALGIETKVTALPTTINGLTHTFKPGIQWFGNALERKGYQTTYDALEGFDRYIEGVADVIYQTDNIQNLRALASQARYRTGDEGIRNQIDEIRARKDLSEEDKKNRIDKLYQEGRFALSNFVVELDEYTNLLANKKSLADRTMEQKMGRQMYNLVKGLESRVAANMVAVNPGSWLTNFIPLTQGAATVDGKHMLKGMWDTLRAYQTDDGFVNASTFLTNRRGSDPIVKTWAQKASAAASKPMEYIDQFTADSLVRARYSQNIERGMSEAEAMGDADAWAASIMADRSKGATPTLFNQSNPMTKLLTQFQLEVNNQLSYLYKDMPKDVKERGGAALAAALIKFALGAFLYNELYEYLIGRRPALDPINMLNEAAGDLTGYELPNLVETGVGAIKGESPDFQTEKTGVYGAVSGLLGEAAEQTPFVGGLLGGGRIPISSALPDVENLGKAALYDKWSGEKRLSTAAKELAKPLLYLAPPFGGGQAKKVAEGIKAAAEGGSYSINSDGEKLLQYPVYSDTPGDAARSIIQSSIFGKTSLPEAKEWINSEFDSYSAKETDQYLTLTDAGAPQREVIGYIDDTQGMKSLEKMRELSEAPWDESIKELGMGYILSEKAMERYMAARDAGVGTLAYTEFLEDAYANAQKRTEKDTASPSQEDVKNALNSSNLSRSQKRAIWKSYGWKTDSPW